MKIFSNIVRQDAHYILSILCFLVRKEVLIGLLYKNSRWFCRSRRIVRAETRSYELFTRNLHPWSAWRAAQKKVCLPRGRSLGFWSTLFILTCCSPWEYIAESGAWTVCGNSNLKERFASLLESKYFTIVTFCRRYFLRHYVYSWPHARLGKGLGSNFVRRRYFWRVLMPFSSLSYIYEQWSHC